MKYESINKRYTELVAEYIGKGYYFNTATMGGSQGEIAHADLTNGTEIIRILIQRFCNWDRFGTEGIEIVVGRCTDEYIKPNMNRDLETVWNNKLEVITSEKFFQIGIEHRDGSRYYGTEDEALAANQKQQDRWETVRTESKKEMPEAAKQIVLPFVKRQPRCKSVKLNEIESVYRVVNFNRFDETTRNEYYVKFRGQTVRIK